MRNVIIKVRQVYKVRLTNANSNAYALERLLNADKKGIMCIGHTSNMKQRGVDIRVRHKQGERPF